jgi:hypothetical protein
VQTPRFVLLDVLDAIEDAALQLQIHRPDTGGSPALERGLRDIPALSQLALIQVFDTHVDLLSGDCENVSAVWDSGGGQTGGQGGRKGWADQAIAAFADVCVKKMPAAGAGKLMWVVMRRRTGAAVISQSV